MLNDLILLKAVDTACAVENAAEAVRAIADHVLLSNDEDGVARFLFKQHRPDAAFHEFNAGCPEN